MHRPTHNPQGCEGKPTDVVARAALVLEGGREAEGPLGPALEGPALLPHPVQLLCGKQLLRLFCLDRFPHLHPNMGLV